jgi:uracil-DNA glycosylase family 4
MDLTGEALRGYLDYLRDLGIYDLYGGAADVDPQMHAKVEAFLRTMPAAKLAAQPMRPLPIAPAASRSTVAAAKPAAARPAVAAPQPLRARTGPEIVITQAVAAVPVLLPLPSPSEEDETYPDTGPFAAPSMPLVSFNQLAPLPSPRIAAEDKPAALQTLRQHIGDCTRCPLAYAGRHTIVFADGDPNASLMFVGEGPGADEDASGLPFVGKAGQLLNNMITAMGLQRESVYIANIVKCRPPKNRVPEPVEANTCSQFLLQQIDIVQPKVVVALGATAAMYLLGVKQPLAALRGQWHDVRGAKCAVTYHPAFLLRDPRQKGEAWKDLQRVMVELNLKPPARV